MRGTKTELLFWKKEPAVYSKSMSPTRSRTEALWSVTHMWASELGEEEDKGSESRRRRETPFL